MDDTRGGVGQNRRGRPEKRSLKGPFLEFLEGEAEGFISTAAYKFNISQETISRWRKEDPEFHEAIQDIKDRKRESYQGVMCKLAKTGCFSAIRYILETNYFDHKERDTKEVSQVGANDVVLVIKKKFEQDSQGGEEISL